MNLFVLGATGRTGRRVVAEALRRGHTVTALVRRASSLKSTPNLRIVVGSARKAGDLAMLLPGHDVAISCLGLRSKADAGLLPDSAAAMLRALRNSAVKRYIVISQGLLFPSKNPVVALLRLFLATAVADSTAMERIVRTSDVDWTIVRPPRLKDTAKARGYRSRLGSMPDGALAMETIDLAAFLLDEAQKNTDARLIVGVG